MTVSETLRELRRLSAEDDFRVTLSYVHQEKGVQGLDGLPGFLALLDIAEAAFAWKDTPREMVRQEDGSLLADFTPQQEAARILVQALARLDGTGER